MPSATLEEARREAYAAASTEETVLHTIELTHSAFRDDGPSRFVRWPITGPDITKFYCKLEDNAPNNPGEIVEFWGIPFEISLPETTNDSQGTFTVTLACGWEIDKELLIAAQNPGVVTMNYREFMLGHEKEGPAERWMGIEVQNPRREGGNVIFNGDPLAWLKRGFSKNYTVGEFPMLGL